MQTNKTKKQRTHTARIQPTDGLSDEALIRLPTVCALTGLAPSTIWRKIKEGKFPSPVRHPSSNRIAVWQFGAVRRHLAEQAEPLEPFSRLAGKRV